MVWSVCRRLLPDRDAAADAFQATFLVLVPGPRRSGSTTRWVRGSTASAAASPRGRGPPPCSGGRASSAGSRRWPARPRIRAVPSGLRSWMKRSAASPSVNARRSSFATWRVCLTRRRRPARLPGRDGREPTVPRAAAAARPPGAARARSGCGGTLGRDGPRRFGRDARGGHQAIGPVRDESSRGRHRAGGGHRSCRRSDPDDVARKAETAGRRRSGADPRDRRGRRPGTPTARARGSAKQAKTAPRPTAGAGGAAVPDLAANRAIARQQLALIDEAWALLHDLARNGRIEIGHRDFRPVGTP